ncbi:hypothetical protein BDW22DRAFT_1425951 [Trametopsis cervina]|nr:hypothetical protein BDW22DRAFT_1425951 [Trametopsis cervina]
MDFTPQAVEPYAVSATEFMPSSLLAPIDLSHSHTSSQPLHDGDAAILTSDVSERCHQDSDDTFVQSSISHDNAFELYSPKENPISESPEEMKGQSILEQHYEPTLYPLLSTEVRRYKRGITIPKRDKGQEILIQPLTLSFEREQMTSGWVRRIHPEGALYYYNENKRIYTEAYLDDPLVLEKIEKCISTLFEDHEITLEQQKTIDRSDLVLEIYHDDDSMCGYYFANHESRTLFWLDEQNMQYDLHEVHGVLAPSHMNELTSLTSPSQYSADKLKQFISLVDEVKDMLTEDCATATLGRIMAEFAWSHFLNYRGVYGARLNSNQSVHNHDPPRRSSVMSIIFLTLFNAPITHWDGINDIYTDDIVKTVTWKNHVNKLKDDWQEYILYSTVLLNANVALLALPNLIPDDVTSSTAGQVASYLSMLTSTGSVIIGLLLQRQHRINPADDASDAHQYLTKYLERAGSTERLAVIYSLPYALLMWAMIAFLVAITFECFNTRNIPTIILSGVALVLLISLIFWCAYAGSHNSKATKAFVFGSWNRSIEGIKALWGQLLARHEVPQQAEDNPELEKGLPDPITGTV